MTLTPLADRVLIKPDPVVDETESGLKLIEDWPQETSGEVVRVGAAVRDVRVGDHVIFGQNVGQDMTIDKERLFVMRERDVLAIVERTA